MSSLPDALHVGFSKCASTFLQTFFASHPEIFLVNQSHFFAPFAYSDYNSGTHLYSRLFDSAAPGQVKLESDEHILLPLFHPVLAAAATTLESVEEVSRRIKATQPDARIVIVIRNQADLIVSRYSEYVLGGGTNRFDTFVEEFLNCSKDGVNYYQNYYSRIVEVFQKDFGDRNVLVLLQEELARNESETIRQLCTFLNISVLQPQRRDLASRRVGLSKAGISVVRRMNKLLVTRQEMSRQKAQVRIPYILYKVIQRGLRTIDFYLPSKIKGNKNAVLTPALKAKIREEFGPDNVRLAALLSKDLSALGY